MRGIEAWLGGDKPEPPSAETVDTAMQEFLREALAKPLTGAQRINYAVSATALWFNLPR